MDQLIIEGKVPLKGTIVPQGNKNEALPVLCASIMSPQPVRIFNIPDIEDVRTLIKILQHLGAEVNYINGDPHNVEIIAKEINSNDLPLELTASIRGSITLMGPLLARTGKVFLPKPGGDKIGRRRVDTHLIAFEGLGAKVEATRDGYFLEAEKLKGAEILLDEASVTGTENLIMAAAVAKGITIVENAASEPHVQGLCRFLMARGVRMEGVGSNILKIHGVDGVENLKSCDHNIGPDYLEIGSFISMAALTNGEITVKNVIPKDLRMIKMVFSRLGIEFEYKKNYETNAIDLFVPSHQSLVIQSDVHGEIPKIDDAPWPAFPADLISIALVTATQSTGTVLIHEKLFESRLYFTDKLIGMGAKIVLCDPHRAVIIGPSQMHGSKLTSPDIRAGMALVIAALAAEGESSIQNIIQVDRGYENIDNRLKQLGAKIKRIKV